MILLRRRQCDFKWLISFALDVRQDNGRRTRVFVSCDERRPLLLSSFLSPAAIFFPLRKSKPPLFFFFRFSHVHRPSRPRFVVNTFLWKLSNRSLTRRTTTKKEKESYDRFKEGEKEKKEREKESAKGSMTILFRTI